MLKKTYLIERYSQEMGITKKDATVVIEKVIQIMTSRTGMGTPIIEIEVANNKELSIG